MDQSRAPYNQPANTIYVSSTDSLQAAVDAAAAMATTSNRYLVVGAPGCDRAYTPAANVDVMFLRGPVRHDQGLYPAHEVTQFAYPLNQTGMLVALRADDGYSNWLVADAKFKDLNNGNLSPAAYCAYYGIPVTHGITNSLIGAATYLTEAQICTLYEAYGCSIASHSYSHGAGPTNTAELVREVDTSIALLRDITRAGAPGNRLGAPIRGFINPGTWGSGADVANVAAYIDSSADFDKWIGRHLRESIQWSSSWAIGASTPSICAGPIPHFTGITNITAFSSLAVAKALLERYARPGMRLEVLCHDPLAAENIDCLGYFVQAVVALRDDRTTYPTRRVDPVTCDGLHLGVQGQSPIYSAAHVIQAPIGMIAREDFWNHGVGAWPADRSEFVHVSGGTATVANDGTEGNYLQCANASGSNQTITIGLMGIPGRHVMLSMRMKLDAGAAVAHYYGVRYDPTDNNAATETNLAYINWASRYMPNTWATFAIPLAIPDWSTGHAVLMLSVPNGATFQLANINCMLV